MTRHRGQGVTTVYAILLMTVLCGMCSLGADYGRVQLAKTELQRAASAAARAAAANISGGVAAAQNAAVAYGAYNLVDGVALSIDPNNDVEFGTWSTAAKTFTVLTGANRANANAIRVTARRTAATGNAIPLFFGRVIGMSNCDVRSTAIALFTSSSGSGFVGLNSLNVGNNANVNSYNSNTGDPGGANVLNSAQLSSNGAMDFGNNTDMYGNLVKGPTASVTNGINFYVSGSQLTTGSNLSYTATENPTVGSSGSVSLGNNQTLSLPAGTYNYSGVTAGNSCTINCTGVVTIYVTGDISVNNNFTVNAYQNKPANLKIRFVGNHTFSANNGLDLTADIYGPGWDFDTKNNAILEGAVVSKTFSVGTNANIDYDTALGTASGSGGTIATVQ